MKTNLLIFNLLFIFLLLSGVPVTAQVYFNKGLIGYLNFDSNAVNTSPNRLAKTDFQLKNTSYAYGFEGGKDPSGALYFYGDGYGRMARELQTRQVTFSLWFNTVAANGGTLLAWEEKGYEVSMERGGRINAYVYVSPNHFYKYSHEIANLADGQWHNVIVGFDGSVFKVYIDGVMVCEDGKFGPSSVFYGPGSLVIGGKPSAQDHHYYTGQLDELLLYNRGLTEHEVAVLSGGGKITADDDLETGLIVYLPFETGDSNESPNRVESTAIRVNGGSLAPSCNPNAMGNQMKFLNGMDDFLSGSEALEVPQYSLCFFLNTNSSKECLIAGWDSAGYQVFLNPRGKPGKLFVRLWVSATECYTFTSAESLNDGQCHHVAVTYDGHSFKVFIDGAKKEDNSRLGADRFVYHSGSTFYIGNYGDHGSDLGYQGRVDEIRLYNRALTEIEIKMLQSAQFKKIEPVRVQKFDVLNRDGTTKSIAIVSNFSSESKRVSFIENVTKKALGNSNKVRPGMHEIYKFSLKAADYRHLID